MRTAITGATGLLGANLAEALLQAGHEVVATRRASSRVDHLSDLDIDWREATLDDEDALTEAFTGCERVYHCAAAVSIRRHATAAVVESNVTGTAAGDQGRTGERYILGGTNLSYAACFRVIAEVGRVAAPRFGIPHIAAVPLGLFYDLKEKVTGKEDQLNSNSIRWAYAKGFIFSSAKAERELGFVISPLEPAIAAAIDWFRAHQML